jgi:hypothetical protein
MREPDFEKLPLREQLEAREQAVNSIFILGATILAIEVSSESEDFTTRATQGSSVPDISGKNYKYLLLDMFQPKDDYKTLQLLITHNFKNEDLSFHELFTVGVKDARKGYSNNTVERSIFMLESHMTIPEIDEQEVLSSIDSSRNSHPLELTDQVILSDLSSWLQSIQLERA